MCDPVSIGVATATLGVGTAVAGHIGQNQASAANAKAANLTYANEREIIGQQSVELDQEHSEKSFDTALTALQSEGSIAASAGETGLGTSSITQSLHASMFGIGRNASLDDVNDRNARRQLVNKNTGNDINRQAQIASKPKAGIASLVLGVGNGVMQGVIAGMAAKGK